MGPYPGWGAVATSTWPWGKSEQPGKLLIEAPHGLGIAPPVKTRPKRPDPPLTKDRAGLDGSLVGLRGEPACLVDVLLLELHEGQFKQRLGSAAGAGRIECLQGLLQGPLGGGELTELPVATAGQGGQPPVVKAVHPGRILIRPSLPDGRLGLAERHKARLVVLQAGQCLGLKASQPCSGGGSGATRTRLAGGPSQRQGGCGFAVAGSDQALEPSYVRIQCRIAGLAGCDRGVGVIPLGQLLVAQVMEQPGGVAGRLTGDGTKAAPQQPVLGAPKQPGHPRRWPVTGS